MKTLLIVFINMHIRAVALSPMKSATVEVPPHFVDKCEHQGCLSPMNLSTVNKVPPHLFINVNIRAVATSHEFSY